MVISIHIEFGECDNVPTTHLYWVLQLIHQNPQGVATAIQIQVQCIVNPLWIPQTIFFYREINNYLGWWVRVQDYSFG